MKFNIFLTLQGPAGRIKAPNVSNPVEADSIQDVLRQLSEKLTNSNDLIQITGVEIVCLENENS